MGRASSQATAGTVSCCQFTVCARCRALRNYRNELHAEDLEARADLKQAIQLMTALANKAPKAVQAKMAGLDADARVDYIVKHFKFHEALE